MRALVLAVSPGAYLVSFGAGVSSFLAPCVVPLVPAYVSFVCGEPLADLERDRHRFQERLFAGSLLYVLGMALVFVPLGLAASAIGVAFRDHQAGIARAGGIVVVLLGLQQLGVLRRAARALGLRPRPILPRIARAPEGGGRLRPLVFGLVFGLAWTPCVGPILGAVLVIAADSASAESGAGLLFAYALGVGVPFLGVALLFVNFPALLRPLARRAAVVARIAGVAMVVLGVLLASSLYTSFVGYLARFAPSGS